MGSTHVKAGRLHIRCDNHARELLNKAAAYEHVSVSEFVLKHALVSAEQVVQANESITLRQEEFQAFLTALNTPTPPTAAMKIALQRHAEQVAR